MLALCAQFDDPFGDIFVVGESSNIHSLFCEMGHHHNINMIRLWVQDLGGGILKEWTK